MKQHKRVISLETWDRKFIFETFSQREFPYVGITTPLNVTELKKTVKENRWSFYGVMSYAVSMAVNSVSEFKRRIEGKQIVEYDHVDLSFTVLNKANNCNFAHVPYTCLLYTSQCVKVELCKWMANVLLSRFSKDLVRFL